MSNIVDIPPPPPIIQSTEEDSVECDIPLEDVESYPTGEEVSVPNAPVVQNAIDKSQEFVVNNERALLSISLRSPARLSELCSKVTADFFLFGPHKIIFLALSSLFSKVDKVDLQTLNIRCDELGLDKRARDQYLPLLYNSGFDDSSFELHLEAVKNAFIKFQLHVALVKSLNKVEQNKSPDSRYTGEDLLGFSSEEISKLNSSRGLEDKVVCFSDRARDLVMERYESKTDIQGLSTGIETLDTSINGLQPGAVTVVSARMKVGKSALLANIADHVAYQTEQSSVLFISTEMKTDEDILRTLAIRTYVKQRSIENGQALDNPEEKKLLLAALDKMESSPCQIYHEYMPSFTVESVVARCKYWLKKIDNLGLIIFDYIKLPPARELSHAEFKEHQLLGELTNALKNSVAGEEDVAVLTACQLNRENQVADSDRIARFANNILKLRFQTQKEYTAHGDGKTYGTHFLEIRETRSGGTGTKIPLRFYQTCLKFAEAELFQDEDEEDEAFTPTIETPLDQVKSLEQKYRKPNNVTKKTLEMTMGTLIKGFTDAEVKDRLEESMKAVSERSSLAKQADE